MLLDYNSKLGDNVIYVIIFINDIITYYVN